MSVAGPIGDDYAVARRCELEQPAQPQFLHHASDAVQHYGRVPSPRS
jgi:hypothetical protein